MATAADKHGLCRYIYTPYVPVKRNGNCRSMNAHERRREGREPADVAGLAEISAAVNISVIWSRFGYFNAADVF